MKTDWKKETSIFDVAIPTLDGKSVAYTVPVEVVCEIEPHSGEEILTHESLALIEKTKARHMGLLAPEDIHQLRKRLQLTQKQFTEILQIGGKTWSRWETGGERPSRSMNILLRALWDEKLDIPYLESMGQPLVPLACAFETLLETNKRYGVWGGQNKTITCTPSAEEYSYAA